MLNIDGNSDRRVACACHFTETALFVLGLVTVISGVNFLGEF